MASYVSGTSRKLWSYLRPNSSPGQSSSVERTQYQSIPVEEDADTDVDGPAKTRVSPFEYGIFMLLGCAMLWSWNMFLACTAYFQGRFASDDFALTNFQPFILAVSTVTNLGSMLYLMTQQKAANYPLRICISLVLNCVNFTILAFSTVVFVVEARPYLVFVLVSVFFASLSTGFSQNGVMAFVNRFGTAYTHAIMTGQGVAGVLPALVQIISVVAIPESHDDGTPGTASPKSAFVYFITSTLVSSLCLFLFLVLLRRHSIALNTSPPSISSSPASPKAEVSMLTLVGKLPRLSFAMWFTFTLTLCFPVFTKDILSIRFPITGGPTPDIPRFFMPDVFIPWGFLVWNVGDLLGRFICGFPSVQVRNGSVLAVASLARIAFIPAYLLCNIKGRGAVVESDVFYTLVQLGFGMSNGWIGTNCMMAAPGKVEKELKEVVGGFMGLCLVVGLATGSVLSFFVGNWI